jgi:apolipoprotein N-acyltransferase
MTAVIDPARRTIAELPPGRSASTVTTVRWMRSHTVYEALGSAPAFVIAATAALMTVRKRRSSS